MCSFRANYYLVDSGLLLPLKGKYFMSLLQQYRQLPLSLKIYVACFMAWLISDLLLKLAFLHLNSIDLAATLFGTIIATVVTVAIINKSRAARMFVLILNWLALAGVAIRIFQADNRGVLFSVAQDFGACLQLVFIVYTFFAFLNPASKEFFGIVRQRN